MTDERLPLSAAAPAGAAEADARPRGTGRPELRFVASALAIAVGLVGLFRVPWVQRELLIPYALGQQRVAGWALGLEKLPVVVNFSCTGADVMALCLAAVLAFPAPLAARLRGAAVGLLLVSVLNTARIGTLSLAVGDRALFDRLHLLVWPAILIIAVSLYVFGWMRSMRAAPAAEPEREAFVAPPVRRFALWLVALTALYVAGASWYLESAWLRATAAWATVAGAGLMHLCGVSSTVAGNQLTTAHGSFVVTTTCIATPLVPVYFAAVLALPMSAWRRLAWVAAGPPVFFALGTARLLVLALPAGLVPSHANAIHAFNQSVFAALLTAAAAVWTARGAGLRGVGAAARRGSAALGVGLAVGVALGAPWTWALDVLAGAAQGALGHGGHLFADPQGALRLLPAFQLGLFAALAWAARERLAGGWRRAALAAALLAAAQLPLVVAVGELVVHARLEPHVRDLRAWAVLAPVVAVFALAGGFGRLRRRARPASVAAARAS